MDGRKNNKGKKKEADKKKVPITIYKTAEDIKMVGGKDRARSIASDAFDLSLIRKII